MDNWVGMRAPDRVDEMAGRARGARADADADLGADRDAASIGTEDVCAHSLTRPDARRLMGGGKRTPPPPPLHDGRWTMGDGR